MENTDDDDEGEDISEECLNDDGGEDLAEYRNDDHDENGVESHGTGYCD